MANSFIEAIKQKLNQGSQTSLVLNQPFPFDSGTMRIQVTPWGDVKIPPTVFPSGGQADNTQKKTTGQKTVIPQTASVKQAQPKVKKPLTAETIQQATQTGSPIPLWPYTPEGFSEAVFEAVKQGKISPAQLQQLMQAVAQQDLSVEGLLATLKQELDALPNTIKAEIAGIKTDMEQAYKEVQENLQKQVEIAQKYADKKIDLLTKTLQSIEKVFTDLMKEKPNLEPDKWTLFGRQLAMALGSISALAHPGYAPYFYMAIPQVVQYWQNEDMYNFEKAMKKFELALQLAGTQIDFYNQLMERNLEILETQKEKELLPVTLTGQLLLEKYHTFVELYAKMAPEQIKVITDRINTLLAMADIAEKHRHYQEMEKLQEFANQIRLLHYQLDAQYKNAKLALERKKLAILNNPKSWKVTQFLISKLATKIQDPQLLADLMLLFMTQSPERALLAIKADPRFSLWGDTNE